MNPVITFVSLPDQMRSRPYAFLALASYINARTDYKANILNLLGIDNFEETLLARLKKDKPLCVGFACYTCNYPYVMKLSALVKKHIACKIVVGNVHASLFPEDFIFQNSPVDYAVIGEGEITMVELFDSISKGLSSVNIPGIASLDAKGEIVRGEKRQLIRELKILPQTDYDLVEMEPYLNPAQNQATNIFLGIPMRANVFFTARGCASACEFCAANTVWKCNLGSAIRFRPLDDVISEIMHCREKYDIQGFMLADDSFTVSRKRVFEFCREMEGKDLFWAAQSMVAEIDEELVVAMRKAGCLLLYFGVESGSDAILKRINKRQTVEQIVNAFSICRKHGIRRLADIMCNHPGETEEDIHLTLELLKRIKPDEVCLSVMTPYPGTQVYEKYIKSKLRVDQYHLFGNIGQDVVKYFKMCDHNIPPQDILNDYSRQVYRFKLPGSVTIFFQNFRYSRKVIFSPYSGAIIRMALWNLVIWLRYFIIELLPKSLRMRLKLWRDEQRRRLLQIYTPRGGSVFERIIDNIIGKPDL